MGSKYRVLLVHGLSRTPLSLYWLAVAIRRAGYRTANFSYIACFESHERILERLRNRMRALGRDGTYAIVAHSLGGLLVRAALAEHDVPAPSHVVMLGTPNQGSRMAEWAVRFVLWRWLAGESGRLLADREYVRELPGLSVPYTNVAGTRGIRLSWLPHGDRLNDGLVGVDETSIESGEEVVVVKATHSFLMNRRSVQAAVIKALAGSLPVVV